MLPRIILASQSPRRREMLKSIISDFELASADIDETVLTGEQPEQYVTRLAVEKAQAIAVDNANTLVIGSDTTVVAVTEEQNQLILGKPEDLADSQRMFALLSAKTHLVMTAFAFVYNDKVKVENVITEVNFRAVSEQEVEQYWQTGEPQDKAGSYGLQGIGGKFVKSINGSVSAVIGLPLVELEQGLIEFVKHEC